MDCRVRAGLECQAALIQAEIDLLGVSIDEHELASQGKKRRRGSVLMSMNWPVRVRRDEGGDGGVEPG